MALALVALTDPGPATAAAGGAREADVFGATPVMAAWARRQVPDGLDPEGRLRALTRALADPPTGLGLRPADRPMTSARQAFATRRADCVGYALLFAALAEELGIAVHFVLFEEPEGFEKRGRLLKSDAHMAVAWEGRGEPLVFELGSVRPGIAGRPIPKRSVLAILQSNEGVARLERGEYEAAADVLRAALELDASLLAPWVNLAVARRALGDRAGAGAALRQALRLDPGYRPARRNLAAWRLQLEAEPSSGPLEEGAGEVARVEAVLERWAEAAASGDVELLMTPFDEAAVIMPANRPALEGRGAIRRWEEDYAARFRSAIESRVLEVVVSGDLAVSRLALEGSLEPRDGGTPRPVEGKALVVLRQRQPGEWRILRLIGNSDRGEVP